MALHGAVRGTVDIDIAISWDRKTLAASARALNEIGLVSRLPVRADDIFDFRNEYIENRKLVGWDFYNHDDLTEQVDIIITYDLRGKRIRRFQVEGKAIPVLSLKELIETKKKGGRPQDLEDVRSLERLS